MVTPVLSGTFSTDNLFDWFQKIIHILAWSQSYEKLYVVTKLLNIDII